MIKNVHLNRIILVITNGKEPVAIAGVMGGANSEVHDGTTTVVIESAYFAGGSVRQTSKDHNLRSDASARFEKGVDPNRVILAAERAASLLAELAGGEVLAGSVIVDELDKTPAEVVVSPDFINNRLGMKISLEDMTSILTRLKFDYQAANGLLYIKAPTRRQDIKIEEDIIEEIARMYGYDEIPMTLPVEESKPGGLNILSSKTSSSTCLLRRCRSLSSNYVFINFKRNVSEICIRNCSSNRIINADE